MSALKVHPIQIPDELCPQTQRFGGSHKNLRNVFFILKLLYIKQSHPLV